jgi:hypothetical protein
MQVIRNELVVYFDVDGTLILDASEGSVVVSIVDPYDGKKVLRAPHLPHIKLLTNYFGRDAHIIVWSKNGNQWAEAVVKALGIEKYVHQVMGKPFVFVDDEKPKAWMGEHVFMPADSSFGRD